MFEVKTFYLSRIIGNRVYSKDRKSIGRVIDLIVDLNDVRPKVFGMKISMGKKTKIFDFGNFAISKEKGQYLITCSDTIEVNVSDNENVMFLVKNIFDRQLVDMNGKKVVRVNDLRMAVLTNGTYLLAVDVGIEGLIRRLGVAKPINSILKIFGISIPSKLILWDEVANIGSYHSGITLSKEYSKLNTLHPSDLADIIEDLDRNTQLAVFSSLDEETALDVLEELQPDAQVSMLKSLSLERAADILEKMPADEVADILDEMKEDQAEELLNEMEGEASEEVRELMEYEDNEVGSIMSTDYIFFKDNMTINDTLTELRRIKPESDSIYYLYVLDDNETLVATVSLRDMVISEPDTMLSQIMNRNIIYVYDEDKIGTLAENISKYNLLAMPVVDKGMKMMGMVIIDDVIHDLLKSKRRRV